MLGLEPLRQELRRGRGEQERQIQQIAAVSQRDPAGAHELTKIVRAPDAWVGRRAFEVRDHGAGEPSEILVEPHESVGVATGEPPRLLERLVRVVADGVVRAVGEHVERRTGGVDADAALHQSHVAPDRTRGASRGRTRPWTPGTRERTPP